jgi:hypothetical protein
MGNQSAECGKWEILTMDCCRSFSKRSTRVELVLGSSPFRVPPPPVPSIAASIAAAAAAAAMDPPSPPSASALPSALSDSSCRRNSCNAGRFSPRLALEFSRDIREWLAMSNDVLTCRVLREGDNNPPPGDDPPPGEPRRGRSNDGRLRTTGSFLGPSIRSSPGTT